MCLMEERVDALHEFPGCAARQERQQAVQEEQARKAGEMEQSPQPVCPDS